MNLIPIPLTLAFLLGSAALTARGQITTGLVTHVVQISLDGLGGRYLQTYLSNAPAQFPTFVRLTREGAFTMNARCDFAISETVPNHASMFTARPVLQPSGFPNTVHHGYNNNFPGANDTIHASGNPAVPYKASFFDVAHDHGLSTAFYASKTRLAICDRSYNAIYGALDLIGEDNGRDKIDSSLVVDYSGNNITNEVNQVVQNLTNATPTRYIFAHIAEPDLTGHSSGWGSANWSNMVRLVDGQLARVLQAIDNNPVLSNRTAVLITADHGGGGVTGTGHTEAYHVLNYTIPFFLWGPGIPAGTDAYRLFANRADPGTNRLDYTVDPQPIRDGDIGNVGLALLGLPPIPDSFLIPNLAVNSISVQLWRLNGGVRLSWPANAGAFRLEMARTLSSETNWTSVNATSVMTNGQRSVVLDDDVSGTAFYRLAKP